MKKKKTKDTTRILIEKWIPGMGDDRIFALSCVNLYIDYKEKGTKLGNDRRNSITKTEKGPASCKRTFFIKIHAYV